MQHRQHSSIIATLIGTRSAIDCAQDTESWKPHKSPCKEICPSFNTLQSEVVSSPDAASSLLLPCVEDLLEAVGLQSHLWKAILSSFCLSPHIMMVNSCRYVFPWGRLADDTSQIMHSVKDESREGSNGNKKRFWRGGNEAIGVVTTRANTQSHHQHHPSHHP